MPKPLLYAQHGDINPITCLLDQGLDVNSLDSAGRTPIYHAIKMGHLDIVKYLKEQGADIDHEDCNGHSALYYAIKNTPDQYFQVKFSPPGYGPQIEYRMDDYKIPRTLSENERIHIVQYLLNQGAKVDLIDINNRTPLHYAAQKVAIEIIECLLKHGASASLLVKDNDGKTPLHYVAAHKSSQVAKFLLSKGSDIYAYDKSGDTSIHICARNPNDGMKAVYQSNKYKQESMMELFLHAYNEKPNFNALLNNNNSTPLHEAVKAQNVHAVSSILRNAKICNIDINALDNIYCSPLSYAVRTNNAQLTHLLLNNNADPNSGKGELPLHYAASNGQYELVTELIALQGEVNIQDLEGWTPLHAAVQNRHIDIIQFLIEHGANVNIQESSYQQSSLHIAITKNDTHIVRILLDNGADICLKNREGVSFINLALNNDDMKVILQEKIESIARDIKKIWQCITRITECMRQDGMSYELDNDSAEWVKYEALDNHSAAGVIYM